MGTEEESVLAAARGFYAALELLISGAGADAMRDAWHHTEQVTTGHPTGEWSRGWDEVWATWEVFAGYGNAGSSGSTITELVAQRYGDVAYTTGVFVAGPGFGSARLSVTNIFHKKDGVWKVVHHHADKLPSMADDLERMAAQG